MKRRTWALASSLGVLGLATVPLGCFSDTSTPPPLPQIDASLPGVDATTPVDDSGVPITPVDAGTDVAIPVIDAGPQPLTLTVLLSGAPEPGVNIVFQDATGAVVTTAITDATGTVSQFVAPGSQVTALMGTLNEPNIVTIQSVEPGDVLRVIDPSSSGSAVQQQQVAVTLPAPIWDSGTAVEAVYAGDCYNPLPYTLYLYSGCQTATGQFPLLARSWDTNTGQELGYTYQLGNNAQPDGGLPDGDTALPINISLPWMTSNATATITATNPPGLPVAGETTSTANDVGLDYKEIAQGVATSDPSTTNDMTDDAGTQTASFVMHPGYPDFVQGEAFLSVGNSSGIVVSEAATRAPAQSTSLAMSFDLSTLPLITATALDSTDGGTPAQPTVTWTATGPLTAASGIFVSSQWSSSGTDDAGNYTYVNGTWTIVAPPTATSVQAPALPLSLAAWAPVPTAQFYTLPRMGVVQASFVNGYDAGFRGLFGGVPFLTNYQLVIPTLPVNGTVYLSGIYQNEG